MIVENLRHYFQSLDAGDHQIVALIKKADGKEEWFAAMEVIGCAGPEDAANVMHALEKDFHLIADEVAGYVVPDAHFGAAFEQKPAPAGWTVTCCFGAFPSQAAANMFIQPLHAYCIALMVPMEQKRISA